MLTARGSFSKLRSVWPSKSLRKGTKIKIFNACVKSVLLYGCETWLVTKEIQRKIQTFVNRCLRYTWSVRKVSDLFFLCEHMMDYNLARLHEPTLNLSAHA